MFYNAALSLPLLGAAVMASGEVTGVLAYPRLRAPGFQVCAVAAVCRLGPMRKGGVSGRVQTYTMCWDR